MMAVRPFIKWLRYTDGRVAEGAGFEPASLAASGFQDRRFQPLTHPSGWNRSPFGSSLPVLAFGRAYGARLLFLDPLLDLRDDGFELGIAAE